MRQLLCLVIVLVVFADGIKINSADNVYNKLFAIPVDPIKATVPHPYKYNNKLLNFSHRQMVEE
jgi:hypothetical protein